MKIVVPFASGGSGDIFARVVGQYLSDAFKQPFVIENRPGAGSIIGSDAVAKSAPDGYTLLLVSSAHATNKSLVPNKPFVLMRDLVAVAPINYFDMALVVPLSLPANNVQELIALARKQAGQAQLRVVRTRHAVSHGARTVQSDGQDRYPARALQGSPPRRAPT